MEQQHKTWIEDQWPQTRGRVFRWGHWSDFDVPDPYQREERAFREALALLDRGLSDWKGRL
jgi:protein-tyrosine phosphatase